MSRDVSSCSDVFERSAVARRFFLTSLRILRCVFESSWLDVHHSNKLSPFLMLAWVFSPPVLQLPLEVQKHVRLAGDSL